MKNSSNLFKTCYSILAFIIILNTVILYSAYAGEKYKVIGSSYIGDMTEDTVLLLAKSEAKRRAVEQAVKKTLKKKSKSNNVMVLTDVVLSLKQWRNNI